MKRLWLLIVVPTLAGCLSSAPKAPTCWTIDISRTNDATEACGTRLLETVRIASVDVRAPYSGQRLAVLRADGSVVFDGFNAFASTPALILKGMSHDVAESSGRFARVLDVGSSARSDGELEIVVTELALDCRREGVRTASVGVDVMLVKSRAVIADASTKGTADAASGDYSAAFSSAFSQALRGALGKLSTK